MGALPAAGPFLTACAGTRPTVTPVWFMRQAGRALPEYRRLRAGVGMLESCQRPDLVTEITLQPVRRLGTDAAILFSDIVVPLAAAGVDLDIVAGTGPVIAAPIRSPADLARLPRLDPGAVAFVADAVRMLVRELGPVPLIGFAGAPFTLASYLVEGGPSRTHARTKALMYGQPVLWHGLLDRLADITLTWLQVQVQAGVAAVQLFDSWAGALCPDDYRAFVGPHSARVLAGVRGVPRVHFGVGTGELLADMAGADADVVGVDWRVPLDVAAGRVVGRTVQGNLDPTALLAPPDVLAGKVHDVLRRGLAAPAHVFNLGHGVLPETDPDALARVVDLVHAWRPAGAEGASP